MVTAHSTVRPNTYEGTIQIIENGTAIDEYLKVDRIINATTEIYYWADIQPYEYYDEMINETVSMFQYTQLTKWFDIPSSYQYNNETVTLDPNSRDDVNLWVSRFTSDIKTQIINGQ